MEKAIIENFPDRHQIKNTICWAAGIEMILKYNQIDFGQYYILKDFIKYDNSTIYGRPRLESEYLDNFCNPKDTEGYPLLRTSKFYYYEFNKFKLPYLEKNSFPDFIFFSNEIKENRPILLDINYPEILKNQHVVIVKGVLNSEHHKFLIIADPKNKKTVKTTYCDSTGCKNSFVNYALLYTLNYNNKNCKTLYNFRTNNLKSVSKVENAEHKIFYYNQIENVVSENKNLFIQIINNEEISFESKPIEVNIYSLESIIENNESNKYKTYHFPVFVNNNPIYELIIGKDINEHDNGKYFLISIGECSCEFLNAYLVKVLKVGDKAVSITNESKKIIWIEELDFLFFEYKTENERIYFPLADYPQVDLIYLEEVPEIKLVTILSRVIENQNK